MCLDQLLHVPGPAAACAWTSCYMCLDQLLHVPGPAATCAWTSCYMCLDQLLHVPGPAATCAWTSCYMCMDQLLHVPGPAAACAWTSCYMCLDQLLHVPGPAATCAWTSCYMCLDQLLHVPGPAATCKCLCLLISILRKKYFAPHDHRMDGWLWLVRLNSIKSGFKVWTISCTNLFLLTKVLLSLSTVQCYVHCPSTVSICLLVCMFFIICRARLKAKNLMYINQILQVLRNFMKSLQGEDRGVCGEGQNSLSYLYWCIVVMVSLQYSHKN